MANYQGDYYTDSNRQFPKTILAVFGVTIDGQRNSLGGSRFETTFNFDEQYVPSIFLTHTQANNACCKFLFRRIRHVRIYYASNTYLFVPNPFRGDTYEYQVFMQQLENNSRIVRYEYYGEIIQHQYISRFVHG